MGKTENSLSESTLSNKYERKRRDKVDIEPGILTKEEIRLKLHEKLRSKQKSRLSRHSRENMMEKLEDKIKVSTGKDIIKFKKELKELEIIDEKEIQNSYERTIPNYD